MSDPLVSICLPTYNYAHYLPESIASCLRQTYERLEVIIVDDDSADNSREVIQSFDDPRIRFVENSVRLGLVENWNKALSLARGEVIKFLFADDLLRANALEQFVAPFTNPDIDLVFSSCEQIDGAGEALYVHEPYQQTQRREGRAEAKRCILQGNYIGSPSGVALRGSAVRAAGDFNEFLRFHADQEMWIRILLQGDGYFVAEPLVSVRIHEGSETRRLERTKEAETEIQKFMKWCLEHQRFRSLLTDSEVAEWLARAQPQASVVHRSHFKRLKRIARRLLQLRTVEPT